MGLLSTLTALLGALPRQVALGAFALPLVEIELPWNPPELTQIRPMYLFGGLIGLVFVALVLLYFYEPKTKEN